MPRKAQKQVRIGRQEKKILAKARYCLKHYRIFWSQKKEGETEFNKRIIDWLRQHNVHVLNKSIPCSKVAGETFRPECFYKHGSGSKLFAIECKRLTKTTAKGRWKEGLSQALLYTSVYKYVFLVLFDFTAGSAYGKAFGRGNAVGTRFAARLRKKYNVEVIPIPNSPDH